MFPTQEEYEKYRSRRKKKPDVDATYVCPMAINSKTSVFVELDWKTTYKGEKTDFEGLLKYILERSKKGKERTRKRKRRDIEVLFLLLYN